VLAQRDAQWVMAGPLPAIQDELPESVRSMVQKKIGALTDADRLLLSVAAVQGQEFDSTIVAVVAGMDAATTEDRLEALEHMHGVVRLIGDRTFPDATLSLRYAFVHILYQNALYASLRPTRRVALSAAVADALLQRFGRELASIASELAVLCAAARHFERAAEYFLLAAQRAVSMSAYKEAAVLARRGLEAVTLQPASVERAHQELRLQTVLGPALMSTVGLGASEVEATYIRARELCRQIGDTPQLFPVLVGLFHYWLVLGKCQTADELAQQLLAIAEKTGEPALVMLAHGSHGDVSWIMGRFETARTCFEQAKAIYVPEEHHSLAALYYGFDVGVASRHALGVILWLLGYPDQSVQHCNEAIALARKISHPYSLVLAQIFTSMVHQLGRNVQATAQQAQAAITLATELEFESWLPWARVLGGWAQAHQGQPDEGITQLREGIASWNATGSVVLQPYFLALLADAYASNGEPAEALTTLAEALAITERTDERYFEAELYRLKGEMQNDPAAAEACFDRAIALARRQAAKSFELRAALSMGRLYRKQEKKDAGQHVLAQIYSWFSEGFGTPDMKEAAAFLETHK
jgi:predicted ATPase